MKEYYRRAMSAEERESEIERRVNKEIRKIKAHCIVWIKDEKTKVGIYNCSPNPRPIRWVKSYYDKSLLDGSDEEIAMQILLDFTFNTGELDHELQ